VLSLPLSTQPPTAELTTGHAKGFMGSYQRPIEAKAPATVWNSQGAEAGAWRTFKPSDEAFSVGLGPEAGNKPQRPRR
jgi:hypothetical protein